MYRNLAPGYRKQNMVMSPLGVTSSMAMLFLGSRGDTADELDALLNLDSMIDFNPHVGFFKFLRYMNQKGRHKTAVCNILFKQADKGEMFSGYHSLIHRFYRPTIKSHADLTAPNTIQESINGCMAEASDGDLGSFIGDSETVPAVDPSLVTASATFFNGTLSPALDVQPVDVSFLRFPSALRHFSGVNGIRDLTLGGLLQLTEFHLGDGSVLHQYERAFLYAVRHDPTGAILLMGRYLDPHSFV
ncbi:serpin B6-like [Pollicipes pollicipes]|uniref:serpin B6-like n=1 Tax=Pollicipes pollicipes TaxID=41117 RepID=UPI0018852733|nr:serpin B6-like [Pollicipes pollicipes]